MLRLRSLVPAFLVMVFASLVGVPAASAATVTIDMVDFEYEPDPAQAQPGDTVTWTNSDPEPHTATADTCVTDPGNCPFDVFVNPGESGSAVVSTEGTFSYFCRLHGAPGGQGMAGVLQVGTPPPPPTVRLAADDNVGAAIAWSQHLFPSPPQGPAADFALLARHDVFADSLSSGAAQGRLGGPLLLTPGDALDARVSAELNRLDVHTVYILGGVEAIFPAVEDSLVGAGFTVRRVAGDDRISTAVAVAERLFPEARSAIVARAFGDPDDPTRAFADSLGAGAFAAASGQPLLLSETGGLSGATRAYLETHPIHSVTLVGGEAALSAQVASDIEALGIGVNRAAGPDRAATAVALAGMTAGDDDDDQPAIIVDGADANAWAAGFPAAAARAPVLLVINDDVPSSTLSVLIDQADASTQLICAPFVSDTACARAEIARDVELFGPGLVMNPATVLVGATEVPGPGDADASGLAFVLRSDDPATLCVAVVNTFNLGELTAAHIHAGAEGVAGPPAIPLNLGPTDEPGELIGCAFGQDAATVADVLANPANYYLNLHTAEFPDGAIRGQLFVPTSFLFTQMLGAAQTPPGDPDAFGLAVFLGTPDPAELCGGVIFLVGLENLTSAHIHRVSDNSIAVPLAPPGPNGGPLQCYGGLDPALVADINANPGNYYVNVHNTEFPGGAIRGVLAAPFAGAP